MERKNSLWRQFPNGVARFALPLYLVVGGAIHAQAGTEVSQGTVNISLANSNGIVLLTDSVQSHREADGWHHTGPVQKLFRLDDKTVCSIAGFASETGWIRRELNTEVTGIIADVKDQLAQRPIPELEAKLQTIGFLVGHYIDVVANRREVLTGPRLPTTTYDFEVIVAGYDADDTPKLKKLLLTAQIFQAPDGHRYWSHTSSPEEPIAEHGLTRLLAGIKDVSLQVLKRPQEFPTNAAIQRYARSGSQGDRKRLSLEEMTALASEMAAQTAADTRFAGFVGGPYQVAILAKGGIFKVDQPLFSEPPRPLKFALMVRLQVQGAQNVVTAPDVIFLWIRSKFVGIRNPRLRLDGQFFYGCEIRDSIVEYAGGLTDFGTTNSVVNSMILPGFPATPEMLRIMNSFKWSREPPNTPALPPTISPKPD